MKRPRNHVEDEDLTSHTMSEKYHIMPIDEDDEEMDVDYLGLSSHS